MSDREEASVPPPQKPLSPVVYTSTELFRGRKEVFIDHADETYCLRITSKDKLLLTK